MPAGPDGDSTAGPPLRLQPDKNADQRFAAIDLQLRQGNWSGALEQLRGQEARLATNSGRRGEWLARLALAEAGSGQAEPARWHWAVARDLAADPFSTDELSGFGAARSLLAESPRRQPGKAPPATSIEPPGPEVQSEVKTQGEMPHLTHDPWEPRQWLRLEVVIDEQGRLGDPLILSAHSGEAAYLALEAMRDWRFQPATKHGQPVATLHTMVIDPPGQAPLDKIIVLSAQTAAIEALLRRELWYQAADLAERHWYALLDTTSARSEATAERAALGITMALRALALAGMGPREQDAARCRWEAAQSLLPSLHALDLAPYGAAGQTVAAWRWAEFNAPFQPAAMRPASDMPGRHVQKPEKLEARAPFYPDAAKRQGLAGKIVVESILGTDGRVHHPAFLESRDSPAPVPFAASALDAVCTYRFLPATLEGKPVKVYYTLTVTFEVRGH